MADLAERIEAATAQLGEQQRRLTTTISALSEIELQFDDGFLEGVEAALEEVTDKAEGLNERLEAFPEEVAAQLDSSIAAVEDNLATAYAAIEAAWTTLNETFEDVRTRLEALPPPAQEHFARVFELLKGFETDLSAKNDELKAALIDAASNTQTLLTEQIVPSGAELAERIQQFADHLEGALRSSFDDASASAREVADSSLQAFSQASDEAIKTLNTTVDNAVQAFKDELDTAINEKIPEARRELIDEASEALAKEIIEGITMSTAGAQISTAMSPYILYLIAIKAFLEALLQAIRLFKNPLGEVF